MSDDLKTRVMRFHMMDLPGQPRGMHMGTSYLVNDLVARIAAFEAQLAAADGLAESTDALHLRALVAGWNGEHLETQYAPHPPRLGVTLKTNAGAVYELDAATTAYRAIRGGGNG